jgi:hypothetical protein
MLFKLIAKLYEMLVENHVKTVWSFTDNPGVDTWWEHKRAIPHIFWTERFRRVWFVNYWYHHLLPQSTNPQGSLKVIIFSWHWRIENIHRLRLRTGGLVRPQLCLCLAEWQSEGHSDYDESHRTTCFCRHFTEGAHSCGCGQLALQVLDLSTRSGGLRSEWPKYLEFQNSIRRWCARSAAEFRRRSSTQIPLLAFVSRS